MAKYKNIKTKEGNASINTKKIKKEYTDEEITVFRFIVITIIMILVIGGLYFLTKAINKEEVSENNTTEEAKIDYSKVNVGTIFNRPYKEYLVIAYDSSSSSAVKFSQLISEYSTKKDAKKIFFCDLNNEINKKYVSSEGITNVTDDFEKLSFGEAVLFEVNAGKIGKIYKGEDNINKILK